MSQRPTVFGGGGGEGEGTRVTQRVTQRLMHHPDIIGSRPNPDMTCLGLASLQLQFGVFWGWFFRGLSGDDASSHHGRPIRRCVPSALSGR